MLIDPTDSMGTTYCKEAFTRPPPIEDITLPPYAANTTVVIAPRLNEATQNAVEDCCIYNDIEWVNEIDECWLFCPVYIPLIGNGQDVHVPSATRRDTHTRLPLAARDLQADLIAEYEACVGGKGIDVSKMNPKIEYAVVGVDGDVKPLASSASLRRGLSTVALGVVVLVCLGLLV